MVFNQTVNYVSGSDPLSQLFYALADPTRRSILATLSVSDATVSELAEPFDMSLPAISKHLKILEEVGLISKTKIAQQRLCRLEAERLKEAIEWLEQYRRFWDLGAANSGI
jgi:DNA-binding transcriptional ArsR family regulator